MSFTVVDKISFTKHLSVMLKAGITLSEALENLSLQATKKDVKVIFITIKHSLDNGSSFYESLSQFPKSFDELFLGIIKVGESTGSLDESLNYLATQLTKEFALKKKVSGALMYPGLVLVATFTIGTFISLFILPKLVDFFSAFNAKLPLSTVLLLNVAMFMKNYGFIFFGTIGALIVMVAFLIKVPFVKLWKDRQILKIPFIGRLLVEKEVALFSRNLSTLIKSGLPIFEALDICGKSMQNMEYRKTIQALGKSLAKGNNLADFLNKPNYHLLFPRLVSDMIAVGEKTGTIDQSLLYVSQFYEDDIEDTAHNLTTILEPAILIIIGLMVAFLSMAIIGPIYQLTGSLG